MRDWLLFQFEREQGKPIPCRLRPLFEWYADLTFLELPSLHTLYLFITYNYILTRPEPQKESRGSAAGLDLAYLLPTKLLLASIVRLGSRMAQYKEHRWPCTVRRKN